MQTNILKDKKKTSIINAINNMPEINLKYAKKNYYIIFEHETCNGRKLVDKLIFIELKKKF